MTEKRSAPYGSWRSPVTADAIIAGTVALMEIRLTGEDVYWLEGRSQEGGRNVLVRRSPDGAITDAVPEGYNVRTRVHEYGGGAYIPHHGTIYFSNFSDNLVYATSPGEAPRALTSNSAMRYADFVVDESRNRLICVREDHSDVTHEAVNTLVALDLTGGGDGTILAEGHDFYGYAALSPDGGSLAWLTWDHPNMPFDGTDFWLAEINDDGTLGEPRHIAGGPSESIFQPSWSPDGSLFFISDRTGWWNIYRLSGSEAVPVTPLEEDLGLPQWVFGMSTYGFRSAGTIIGQSTTPGDNRLLSIQVESGSMSTIPTDYTAISGLRVNERHAAFVGSSPTSSAAVVLFDLADGSTTVLKRASEVEIPEEYISTPQLVEFPSSVGKTAFAFYYPPTNPEFEGQAGELPPLIVRSHGGPTGAVNKALSLGYQYWTSRGFALVDVNYGGSTGYGREYRERLKGRWGVLDVDDSIAAAEYLAQQSLADPKRLAIEGGSAGGYTTLGALAFRDAFAAGASHFGVADLMTFVNDTHKFESRYLFSLIGPYPERADLYHERSPVNFVDQVSCPVILFQGLDDKVVPPSQAEQMLAALRPRGIPVAYLPFEGEGHGFRQAANIKRTLEATLYFYGRIFGFTPADVIEPVPIENL